MYNIKDVKDAYAEVLNHPWDSRPAQQAILTIVRSVPYLLGEIERQKDMLEQSESKESLRFRLEDGW